MDSIIIGQAALAPALWVLIYVLKRALQLPARVIPLVAVVLGIALYELAYVSGVLPVGDPLSAALGGIIAGASAVGLNSGVKATVER